GAVEPGAHTRGRRGTAAGRGDVSGGRGDDICRRPAGYRALGRQGSPRRLHLRSARARHARRDRSGPRTPPRPQPHQQLTYHAAARRGSRAQVVAGVDGVAAGADDHVGDFRLMIVASWLGGWRRVWQASGMALGLHGLTFVLALPFAMLLRDQIAGQLGSSLAAGAVADGVNNDWWREFTAQATGLGATFTPSIIGFASTLDTVSRVLDARYPPTALMWLLGGYLTLWTFLSGGILDRYARQRPTHAHGFFSASGRLFFRLARLTALGGLVYWFLFA